MTEIMLIEAPNIVSSNTRALFTTKKINNKEDLALILNFPKDAIYLPIQKHTNKIHVLESDLAPVVADAVLTDRKGILIGVQAADCVPILLFDKKKSIIGAVHAGWRGTAGQVLKNALSTARERFGSMPVDIMIAFGPSIGQCCYCVGEEVMNPVKDAIGEGDYYFKRGDKYFLDLTAANIIQARSAGIPEGNIWRSRECTHCDIKKFYSYRFYYYQCAKGHEGRQFGAIAMW